MRRSPDVERRRPSSWTGPDGSCRPHSSHAAAAPRVRLGPETERVREGGREGEGRRGRGREGEIERGERGRERGRRVRERE